MRHAGKVSSAHLFQVWAPVPDRVRCSVDGMVHSMSPTTDGWWRAAIAAEPDSRYGFLLGDTDVVVPDPRSPRQPDGVHSPSQLHTVDTQLWTDDAWTGRDLAGAVLYELHILSLIHI